MTISNSYGEIIVSSYIRKNNMVKNYKEEGANVVDANTMNGVLKLE